MSFIPAGTRWYIADVVLEHRIDGDARNVVHINTHLIAADSPDEAFNKAVALGSGGAYEYENTDGQRVCVLFRGLRELNAVHDELEDGAELMYTEEVGVPEERLRAWDQPREQLGVFRTIEAKTGGPNYLPGEFGPFVEGFEPDEVGDSPETEQGAAADGRT